MAASGDLINFDIIENQKENIQSLPGGRSARELARIFSPRDPSDKLSSPSPNDTRTLNDAIRQEYEAELQAVGESDDPLDIYDRYVKWALNAYPSAQATAESGLLPLLERAVKAFLSSPHYKNDSRYLRLWLHYIRLFSDSPRETFAFMARHHVGEGLALFYEEFAGWLESVGRWNQADEVYRLGIDREARPAERLVRKYNDFQRRYEQRTQDNGPSSPALPAVRPALAAKVDPFASATAASADPQAQRPSSAATTAPKTKSGKTKMAIFTDDEPATSQPALGGATKGWDNLGSMQDRRKENKVEAKPWAGETLKAGNKAAPKEKMMIFRDESKSDSRAKEELQSKPVPEHRIREAINPRTGRRERVFVDLDAVYPDYKNPNHEVSFEELRAIKRGWMDMDWRAQKEPLGQISGNATLTEDPQVDKILPDQFKQKLNLKNADGAASPQHLETDGKGAKARKLKVREVRAETQTVKMKFDSPTGGKIRRKSTAQEPTMTMHTRAATDEIYSIFNQPLKAESQTAAESSDFDDDDYTSAGESTGTGRISAASSDFGDDDTTFHRSFNDGDGDSFYDHTQAESVVEGDWTRFSEAQLNPETGAFHSTTQGSTHDADEDHIGGVTAAEGPQRERFIPEMPEDYAAPSGPYRDPVIAAQNRLPFMTPIVERTEYSLPSMTAARSNLHNSKTPSRNLLNPTTTPGMPQMRNLLSTPLLPETPYHGQTLHGLEDALQSPTAAKAAAGSRLSSSPKAGGQQQGAIIEEMLCNPVDKSIRAKILSSMQSTLAAYPGFHAHPDAESNYAPEIQKYMKTNGKRSKSGDEAAFDVPIIDLPRAERSYIIRRELGAGAYAPVYLAESIDSLDSDSDNESSDSNSGGSSAADTKSLTRQKTPRYGFEAIKLEVGPPNAWEFYMIRTVHERLSRLPELARASDSVIRVHELHIFKGESILVEDYRPQGTLLDLVNLVRNEGISGHAIGEGGLDEALAMFFTIELFRTVEALHACGVLHGDIKADNCLIRFEDKPASAPFNEYSSDPREFHYSPSGSYGWSSKGLSLIDFGRGIDMRAFHPNVQFIADWKTGEHECNEIREMRPWTHQIDLYGLAGTVHVMLFGKYIESAATDATSKSYRIREPLKRYWERDIWADVFDLLLNPGSKRWAQMERHGEEIPNTSTLPVLNSMRHLRARMESWLLVNAEKKGLGLQIRKLEAIFAERKKRIEKV
ncbi:Putative Spindle assembly checkpoint protein SLDA [Aspergillus calidoustus]|uniref:Putative Spindle assembly checkpoint protein SLDA n=1 Tax=Aspergillus calidoustus TaxID=454130 RepID=A0A0U5CQV0_ASPCI|nr:Putative Spindle assembly checkpoint protein SLDA [Aspergillus calidoustus]